MKRFFIVYRESVCRHTGKGTGLAYVTAFSDPVEADKYADQAQEEEAEATDDSHMYTARYVTRSHYLWDTAQEKQEAW